MKCSLCSKDDAVICWSCSRKLSSAEIARTTDLRKEIGELKAKATKLNDEHAWKGMVLRLAGIIIEATETRSLPAENIKFAQDCLELLK